MGYSLQIRVAALGAGATNANALAGSAIEFMGEDVMLDVYASADVAGFTAALSGFTGSKPGAAYLPAGSTVTPASTAGAVKTNENFLGTFSIPAGTRLVMPVTNTTGGASNFQALFVTH
jgi:hypothetical protein